jgi:hypothetical protein
MATYATDQANSSKQSPSRDTRDRKNEVGSTRPESTKHEAESDAESHKKTGRHDVTDEPATRARPAPAPAPDPLDAEIDDPYDNVACTD